MLSSLQPTWTDQGSLLVDLEGLIDVISSFVLYVTIAFVLVAVATLVSVKNKDENVRKKTKNVLLGTAIGFSASVAIMLCLLNLIYNNADGKINDKFYLIIGLLGWVALSITVALLTKNKYKKFSNVFSVVATVVAVAYAIVLVVVIPAKKDYYEPLNKGGMYAFTAVLVAVAVVLALLFDKRQNSNNAKSISYAAMCIAMSYALSYIKLFSLPQGGSVTLASMLPIMLYAHMFGAKKGMVAGVVYGLLQFIQSPQYYQSMQVLLDYPIAFGVLGLAGIGSQFKFLKGAKAQFLFGASVAVLFRYLTHVISGYYVFNSWAMEGYTALSWGLVYNLYVLVDLAIILVVAFALFSSNAFKKQIVISSES